MQDLQDIIDFKLHPIDDLNFYVKLCRSELQKNSILSLNSFLTEESLFNLQREGQLLLNKAFHCSQSHNILLAEKNMGLGDKHPCNIEVVSDKGCVPQDLIPENSSLRKIYNSTLFKNFIQSLLSVQKVYPYKDSLSSINYNYYEKNQQLGWHFDNASFAISLMIQAPLSGGSFEYVVDARNVEKNILDVQLVDSILKNKYPVKELQIKEGTLVLFYGSNYLHRVTPVTSNKHRVLVTLNYNLQKNIELSENARLTFFGRTH
jgi:hypothetical protein